MSPRGIRETRFEFVKDLFGEQACGTAVVIEQVRILWILSQSFLKNGQGLRQFSCFEQGDTERVFGVRLLEVWNRFGGIALRQQCVSQQAVSPLEVGTEFERPLQRRNGGRIMAFLDVYPTEIGEGGF